MPFSPAKDAWKEHFSYDHQQACILSILSNNTANPMTWTGIVTFSLSLGISTQSLHVDALL